MSFNTLGLRDEILTAISEAGYTEPTPIQQQAIPLVLQGRDLMACAQTGTGKTAGFTLPILQLLSQKKIEKGAGRRPVRALILSPTRELAAQIHENLVAYSQYLNLRSLVVFGGVSINPQMMKLRGGVDILVATPGRLLDLEQQNALDLSKVEYLVLDEADRMLDMGFIHDIRKVLAKIPGKRQNLLFSATFSKEITELARRLLHNPASVEIERHKTSSEQVTQALYFVDKSRKSELLSHLIERENWQQVLVFCRTKHGSNRLTEYLKAKGINASAIHGNKSQGARTRALADFKAGDVRVLVATDIAARGIDIEELPFVVNFDLPDVPADYVHRIGRTGRAEATGKAISLVCVDEHKLLKDIERLLKAEIPKVAMAGFEPDASIKAEPIENGRNSRGGRRQSTRQPSREPSRQPSRRSGANTNGANGSNAKSDKPRSDKAGSDRPRSDQPRSDKPRSDKPRSDKPRSDKPRSDNPKANPKNIGTSKNSADANSKTAPRRRRRNNDDRG